LDAGLIVPMNKGSDMGCQSVQPFGHVDIPRLSPQSLTASLTAVDAKTVLSTWHIRAYLVTPTGESVEQGTKRIAGAEIERSAPIS